MGVSIDVTERKRAEEALRASEARLAAGVELAGLAFYEVDFVEGVTFVDDRFRDLCGIPAGVEDRASRPWSSGWSTCIPTTANASLELRERPARREDGAGSPSSIASCNPNRGELWIQHLAGVAHTRRRRTRVVAYGVLRDITARKRVEDELRDLSGRLIRAHEEERALLARELHDDVTQRLAVLAIEVGRAELAAPDGAQAQAMLSVREELVRLSEDIHSLAYHLHPSVLEELGLAEALRAECERRGRQGQIDLSVELDPLPAGVGRDAALCLFRVAQEALNNLARHAGARAASVTLRQMDGGLLLAVGDDGVGFDPENPGEGGRLGLVAMRERVRLVNGTLDIESAPGRGTTIVAWVPADGEAR